MVILKIKYVLRCFIILVVHSCGQNDKEIQVPEEEQFEENETFKNPVLILGADPWALKNKEKYYYTHTTGNRLELRETAKMEDLGNANPLTIWTPPIGEEYSKQILGT